MQKNTIIIAILLYIVAAIASYFAFASSPLSGRFITTPVPQPQKTGGSVNDRLVFDANQPKTQSCPLNGAMYSKQQEAWWEKHRPLGVMIENHEDSRPQSGITAADVVYEAVAEGGITRFLVVFYCQDGGQVGPVRSARTYFLDFISEYGNNPLYAHVGGANTPGPADALGQINDYGWQSYNDLNQFSIGFPTYWRDPDRLGHPVATEHTMYSTTEKLWAVGAGRGLTNVDKEKLSWDTTFIPYTFKDNVPASQLPTSQVILFNFWDGYPAYSVAWTFDKTTDSYLRSNGGRKHLDKDNSEQIAAKNVVILYMREGNANDGYEGNAHMLYGTKGTGRAVVFQDGKRINATWSKKNREGRLALTDASGKQIAFNRGLIWFEILGLGNDSLNAKP